MTFDDYPDGFSTARRQWAIIIDGEVVSSRSSRTPARVAVGAAAWFSRYYPDSAVALARLGDLRSLRRFEAGREVTT